MIRICRLKYRLLNIAQFLKESKSSQFDTSVRDEQKKFVKHSALCFQKFCRFACCRFSAYDRAFNRGGEACIRPIAGEEKISESSTRKGTVRLTAGLWRKRRPLFFNNERVNDLCLPR